jgi:membrane protease YdiL (CAAX protease family)
MQMISVAFLLFVVAGLPFLAWSAKRKLDEGFVFPKLIFYAQAVILQLVLLAWAAGVAITENLDLAADPRIRASEIAWAAVLLLTALVAMRISWHSASGPVRQRLVMLVPSSLKERIAWIGVSAAAAAGEEIVFRGVLAALLAGVTGSWLAAAIISSIAFGLGHLVQGWANSVHVAVFGFAFHLLVLASGDLWTAIAVHFAYDMVTGLMLGSRSRR